MKRRQHAFPKHMAWAHAAHPADSVTIFCAFLSNVYFRHCRIGRIVLKESA